MTFKLRCAEPADYPAIASWVPDAQSCARWAGPRLMFPFAAAGLQALLSVVGGGDYGLVDAAGVLCGFGQYWVQTPGAVHLGRIIVSPALRGNGVGGVLCRHLISQAIKPPGVKLVTLRVYRDNPAAVALYTSLGFFPRESDSSPEVLFMALDAHPAII